jgi:hypothetical protein
VASPEISKREPTTQKGGGGRPRKGEKNLVIWNLKSWVLLILDGKFWAKRGAGHGPPAKSICIHLAPHWTQNYYLRDNIKSTCQPFFLQITYACSCSVILIDYLVFYVPLKNISIIWRRHHCRWRAAKFRPMLSAQGLWAGRDLYRATPTVTFGLGFSGLIRRTAPISCLLRHAWGCGESILTRILTGVCSVINAVTFP